jgi:hypothetical protein
MTKPGNPLLPTRRHLLAGVGLGMIGAAIHAAPAPTNSRLPGRTPMTNTDLQRAEAAVWARYVGQDFTIPALSGVALRLVAVEPAVAAGPRPPRARRANFYAVFESVGRAVPDGDSTYVMQSRTVSPLPVFLGKRSVVAGRHRLIAAFS